MAFNWASVAKGKPQTNESIEATRLADRTAAKKEHLQKCDNEREQHRQQQPPGKGAERAIKFCKETGWLTPWPRVKEANKDHLYLNVPKHVNERARDWIEMALADWWPEWTQKCLTVGALRKAFIAAFVPYMLRGYFHYGGTNNFETWEKRYCLGTGTLETQTHEVRYRNILQWVSTLEADKVNPPYWNKVWVACKHITFENCLWAMNIQSGAFQAEDAGGLITGFLSIGSVGKDETLTWLADFENYIPLRHRPKEKCRQWKEQQAKKEAEQEINDMFS